MLRIFCLVVIASMMYANTCAQNIGFSALYNMQAEGFGVGARWELRSEKDWQFVPQFSYFLPFNKVHEWTVGIAVQRVLFRQGKWSGYALGHLGYNKWMNPEASAMKNGQSNNWNGELGAGMKWGKRIKPFIEWRYNIRFQEAHWQLGLLFSVKGGGPQKEKCAAYN